MDTGRSREALFLCPTGYGDGFESMATIRLQMKSHKLPKGGRVAQYTTTIPRDLVGELGWKKGEKILVEVEGSKSIKLRKKT